MQQIELKDGTILPRGTQIAFASAAIAMDPAVYPAPEEFDGLRNFHKRLRDTEQPNIANPVTLSIHNKHAMSFPDSDRLVFGHGRQACPGRFFAVNEMKMILARFLIGYEFKFPPRKSRPRNFCLEEYIVPDPRAKLMMRSRPL